LTSTDYRLWLALALSIVSLLWNEKNRRHTNTMASKLRRESIRLEEFRSMVKDPLRDALAACEEVAQRAEALATSGKTLLELRGDISDLNTEAISALSDLENRLVDANNSIFANDANWLEKFEPKQDLIYQKLDLAANDIRPEDVRRRALSEIKTGLVSLRVDTNAKIDAEIETLSSSS
jgi:hypothetical protein